MINTQILGRLIKDPVVEKTKCGNTFTKFMITTNSGVNKKPLLVTVHAYGKVGEDILKYFDKGVQILVVGAVYDFGATVGDDDLAHFYFIVTCERFEFIGINEKKHAESIAKNVANMKKRQSAGNSLF